MTDTAQEAAPEVAQPDSPTPDPNAPATTEAPPEVAEVFDQLHPIWGSYACPECKTEVQRLYPGYNDPDAGERMMTCPNCGTGYQASKKLRVKAAAPAKE